MATRASALARRAEVTGEGAPRQTAEREPALEHQEIEAQRAWTHPGAAEVAATLRPDMTLIHATPVASIAA